jgi:prevent-host-death family protein
LRAAETGCWGASHQPEFPLTLASECVLQYIQKYYRRYNMGKLLNIIPISDLRQDAAKVLKQVRDSREPIVITQRGRAAAIMLSVEAFEQSERDRELLRLLAKGEKEIESGEGHDLDSVLAEADALLSEEPS